LLKNGEKL